METKHSDDSPEQCRDMDRFQMAKAALLKVIMDMDAYKEIGAKIRFAQIERREEIRRVYNSIYPHPEVEDAPDKDGSAYSPTYLEDDLAERITINGILLNDAGEDIFARGHAQNVHCVTSADIFIRNTQERYGYEHMRFSETVRQEAHLSDYALMESLQELGDQSPEGKESRVIIADHVAMLWNEANRRMLFERRFTDLLPAVQKALAHLRHRMSGRLHYNKK